LMAIPMAVCLFRKRTVLASQGFGIWVAFILWMLGSATQLQNSDRYIHLGYPFSPYLAATAILLYIFKISRDVFPTGRVITVMAIFWIFVVVGGFLGVLFPPASFTIPVEKVMPQRLVANEFVHEMVHPAFARIQNILGYARPRPKAPFVYATNWDGVYPFRVTIRDGAAAGSTDHLLMEVFACSTFADAGPIIYQGSGEVGGQIQIQH
jgi:hypothetical protein